MAEGSEHEKSGRLEVLTQRLQRCTALLTAKRRRDEVVEVVGEASSDQEATEAVSDLLDVDEEHASAIVEMPVQSFNKERLARLEDETSRLEEKVASLSSSMGQDGNGQEPSSGSR